MQYTTAPGAEVQEYNAMYGDTEEISPAEWVCDPALWLKWTHFGQLRAKTSCEVIELCALKFIDCAVKDAVRFIFLRCHANLFSQYIKHNTETGDLDWRTEVWFHERTKLELQQIAFYAEDGDDQINWTAMRFTKTSSVAKRGRSSNQGARSLLANGIRKWSKQN